MPINSLRPVSTVGIDPSVVAPAFATWPECNTWQLKVSGDGAARLARLYFQTATWMLEHCPGDLDAVFIERPVGRFPKRALDHACGVIQAAVVRTAEELFDHPVSVFEVSPGAWKKTIGLGGAAKKPDVAEWAVDAWQEKEPGVRSFTQDEADALAIAAAGAAMLNVEGDRAA